MKHIVSGEWDNGIINITVSFGIQRIIFKDFSRLQPEVQFLKGVGAYSDENGRSVQVRNIKWKYFSLQLLDKALVDLHAYTTFLPYFYP